jgi:hypothetical protein
MRVLAWTVGALGALACGGSGSSGGPAPAQGSATVNGDVSGQPVAAVDVSGYVGTETQGGVASAYAGVVIAGATGTCARAQGGSVWNAPPGSGVLVLEVVVPGASVAPGAYPVGSSGVAQYTEVAGDGTSHGFAGDGTVTFTAVGDTLVGSFDVNLPSATHLTGQFTAPVCAGGKKPF